MVNLDFITNQHGEEIPSHVVNYENGTWFEEKLNCLSSKNVGMGTCLCVNHPTWDTHQISREEVRKIIGENISSLSDLEKEDLFDDSFSRRVEESFLLQGFSIEDVEDWCETCYRLDQNPLPALRKILPYADVEFAYENGGSVPPNSGTDKGIVYVILNKPCSEIENVCLAIVPPN